MFMWGVVGAYLSLVRDLLEGSHRFDAQVNHTLLDDNKQGRKGDQFGTGKGLLLLVHRTFLSNVYYSQ